MTTLQRCRCGIYHLPTTLVCGVCHNDLPDPRARPADDPIRRIVSPGFTSASTSTGAVPHPVDTTDPRPTPKAEPARRSPHRPIPTPPTPASAAATWRSPASYVWVFLLLIVICTVVLAVATSQ